MYFYSANRFEKFIMSHDASDKYLRRLISTRCWIYFDCTIYFFLWFSGLPLFWQWNKFI